MKTLLAAAAFAVAAPAFAADAKVGQDAPAFSAVDSKGAKHSLSDFKGKTVVLEWHNKDCPFVKKHYGSGNMQKLQAQYTAKGVVWLSVLSSAEGKQGFVSGAEADADMAKAKASPSFVLMDPSGE
ncbi:MAG: redoxin domain-containing protein, partial [Elusimicrobia bacterium]|nr:redoxin domain-containing protein [Elusimicrobiota bacterium]